MSKEMREQINKVKNFGQFLNEDVTKNNPYIFDNPILVKMIEKAIEPSSFICTYVALVVKMIEPDNIKIYGFSADNNPKAKYFDGDGDDGHHFGVMNDRYIIDPWIYNNYEDYNTKKIFNRSVFDLQNNNDKEIIEYIYGDKNKWTDITNHVGDFKGMFKNTYKELIEFYKSIK